MANNSPPSDKDPVQRFRRLLDSQKEFAGGESETPASPGPDEPITGDHVASEPVLGETPPSRDFEVDQGTQPPTAEDTPVSIPQDKTPATLPLSATPPPPLGDTPPISPPALDTQGMPLPRRVDEIDLHATRVTPTAYDRSTSPKRSSIPRRSPLSSPPRSPVYRAPSPQPTNSVRNRSMRIDWRRSIGCLLRMVFLALLALIILALAGGAFMLYEYYTIAATLPSVEDLRQRASSFETTRIYDRNGNLLYEILDPNAGRRTYVKLDKISPYLVAATIATEDKSFYSHPGFDPVAIVRAFWQNYQEGDIASGASTITQQLARLLLFSPQERSEQTYMRKVREALLAVEITRRYTRDEILELYFNEIYYGNLAYGVEAAAETYFGTTAAQLTLSQASLLAGLPQAPSVYDVYNNWEATRQRQQQVLTLMYEASSEQGCIYVSNSPERVCVDADAAVSAYVELENYQFNPPDIEMRYPHWVNYVRSLLEAQFEPQAIYRSGFSIYTTLDPGLQDEAERILRQQIEALKANNANSGALVAIRPSTGEILAMVGSADFYNEAIDGQVNMATSPTRQPGSSIKPITYLTALEKGWTASTLIWDVPSEFPPSGDPTDPSPPYKPVNYDGRFHGAVTLRSALANSYNIPAVKTLQYVGIYDNPDTPQEDGMIAMARRLGITTLTRPDYGLSLTLGGGEVSLLEMTGLYSVLANGGRRVPAVAITRILDHEGNSVYEYQAPPGEQVIRAEHAYIISSILSDNEARTPAFGPNSVLNLPFPAAVKTGTTNDFRDNWTLGYTPDIAVGVWVGNPDYTPMQNTTGLTGAAPIWAEFMQLAIQQLTGGNPTPFFRPAGIVDRVICAVSGTEPSQWCPNQRSEIFASDQLPLPKEQDLWTKILFDTWTGLRASPACMDFTKEEFALNVTDIWAVQWLQNDPQGQAWAEQYGFTSPVRFAPQRECRSDDPRPFLSFTSPSEGQVITNSPLDIYARVDASADFKEFSLEYGMSSDPLEWTRLTGSNQPVSQPGELYTWDLQGLSAGMVTLRLRMQSIRDTYAEVLLHLNIQLPTVTPTSTYTPSPTPTYTFTPTPTDTPAPTSTPAPTDTPVPTDTSVPTDTPAPTDTPQPTSTPAPTDTPSPTPGPTSTDTPSAWVTP
jgi:penicillin-binding protein 1C